MRIHRLVVLAALALPVAIPTTAVAQRAHTHHVVHHARAGGSETPRSAPPAPRDAPRPPRPFRDAVWTDGYWTWNGNSFVWTEGAWVHAVPGRRWVPWRWDLQHGDWVLIPGGWVPSHEGHL